MEKFLSRFADQETLPREVYKIAKYYYARAGRQDKAIELYQYMANTWPENDYALLSLKDEAISRIKRYQVVAAQEVIEILLTNFAEHKKLAEALNGIAKAYHQVQDDEKALEFYNYVLANYPASKTTLEVRMGAAIAYIGLNQDEKVNAVVETLMTEFADYSSLSRAVFIIGEEYYNIAMKKVIQKDSQGAAENFIKAVNIWQNIVDKLPQSNFAPEAHYFVAICHKQLKQYSQAVEYFEKVADRWPLMFTWRTYFQIGSAYESMKRAGDITVSEADNQLELVYRILIDMYPESQVTGYTSYKLGKLYYEKSQWDKAIEYFEIFQNASPSSPLLTYVLYHLGESYEKTGQLNSARSVYEIILEKANPPNRYIQEAKEKLQNM